MGSSVSVIVPAFNAEKTIERCLAGLLHQTCCPNEIIVIDDGSTDNTGTILDQFSCEHSSVKTIHQRNAGVSAARNRGLEIASSDCILFVDSDDEVGEDYIAVLMQYADYDYVTCGFHLQTPALDWKDIIFADEGQEIGFVRQYPSKYMGKYYFGSPWAKLYKKRIIDSINLRFPLDIHNGEDILFNFSYLSHAKSIRIVPMCDYYYYYQLSSISHSKHPNDSQWTVVREKEIKNFFRCTVEEEIVYVRSREFEVLRQLLNENGRDWSNQQIRELYRDPLFEDCIQHRKQNCKAEDKFLLFSLEHDIYHLYDKYLQVKKYSKRAARFIKRTIVKIPQDMPR